MNTLATPLDIAKEIALLAAEVDKDWPSLSFGDRFGQAAALEELLDTARRAGASAIPGDFPPRNALASILDWIARASPAAALPTLAKLAGLLACDELLVPTPSSPRPNAHVAFNRHGYPIPGGGTVVVYCHPRPAWRDRTPSPTPVEAMRPALQSRLRAIRYFILEGSSRIRIARLSKVDELAMTEGAEPLRVGLFPIHGYHALFRRHESVTSTTLGTIVHGYRAHSIAHHAHTVTRFIRWWRSDPNLHRDDYQQQLRQIISVARKLSISIVVLPELSVDVVGLEVIRDSLQQNTESSYPRVVFAGSWHIDREGAFVNECAILGRTGRDLVPPQRKSHHYSFQPRRLFRRIPRGLAHRLFSAGVDDPHPGAPGWLCHWYAENISLATEHQVLPTPIGVFAVGICADVLPTASTSPFAQVCALPVDWLVVPSYSPDGQISDFSARGKDFARTNGIFLYVNADCVPTSIVLRGILGQVMNTNRGFGRWIVRGIHRIRSFLTRPPIDALANLPWTLPLLSSLSWRSKNSALIDISGEGIDGLVFDVKPHQGRGQ